MYICSGDGVAPCSKHYYMIKKVFSILLLLLVTGVAKAQSEADSLQVYFPVGSARLNANAISQSMLDAATAICAKGEKFTVLGVASPEGTLSANERLATKRAKAIRRQLVQRTGLPDSMFVLKTKVADKSMLRELAAQDENLPEKAQVMSLLDSDAPMAATLARLKKLDGGIPYLYIKDRLFPYLRASVGSDKEAASYHPQLSATSQPKLIQRDYQAYRNKTRLLQQHPKSDRQNAVAQSKQSRHSSSINGGETEKTAPVDTTKADSAKAENAPAYQQTTNGGEMSKIADSEKSTPSVLPYWVAIALLILALLAFALYHQKKVSALKSALGEAQNKLTISDRKLKNAEEQLQDNEEKLVAVQKKLDESYADGKSLYEFIMNGGGAANWTNDQVKAFVEYYKLQNYPLVHSLETEYDSLSLNHILFEILVDMGKTDQEIQRIMNVSQTTIRSYRFRIKGRKL